MQIPYLLLVQFLSFTVLMGARTVFSLAALEFGATEFEVGTLAAANQAPALVFSFLIGLMADRYSARVLFLASFACGALGIGLAAWQSAMPVFYAASVLCGIWSAFLVVLIQRLVGLLSRRETMTRNFSNQAMMNSLSGIAGPILAGYAIEHFGHAQAVRAMLPLLLGVGILLLAGLRLLPGAPPPGRARGADAAPLDRGLVRIMLISSAVQLAMELFPFYVTLHGHALGMSASAIGLAISSSSVVSLTVRIILPRIVKRYGEERMLSSALYVSATAFALLPFSTSAGAMVVVALLLGVGMAFGGPLVLMLVYKGVARERAGAAIGLRMTANGATRVTAPPLFGALVGMTSLFGVVLFTALLVGASGWAIMRGDRTASGPVRRD